MKKLTIILVAAFVLFSAFKYMHQLPTGIHGTVDPQKSVKTIWAISGTDSVSTIPVAGMFSIEVKPGNWKLFVEAIPPYKNTTVENVAVPEGQNTDVGTIILTQE